MDLTTKEKDMDRVYAGLTETVAGMTDVTVTRKSPLVIRIDFPDVTFHDYGPITNLYSEIRRRNGGMDDTRPSCNQISISIHQGEGVGTPHPHVSAGAFCWAGAPRIRRLIINKKYFRAVLALIDIVHTYTPNRAYHRPESSIPCREEGCENYGRFSPPMSRRGAAYRPPGYVCALHNTSCVDCGFECSEEELRNDGDESENAYYVCDECFFIECALCHDRVESRTILFARYMPRARTTAQFLIRRNARDSGSNSTRVCENCAVRCRSCSAVFAKRPNYDHGTALFDKMKLTDLCGACSVALSISNEVHLWEQQSTEVNPNATMIRTPVYPRSISELRLLVKEYV